MPHNPEILMLHRVLPVFDADNYYFQRKTAISWQRFMTLLDEIEAKGLVTLPASALAHAIPDSAIFLTFDDGYIDNVEAFDEILRRKMTATLFPVKQFVQQGFSPIDDMAQHFMNADSIPEDIKHSLLTGRLKRLLRSIASHRYRRLRQRWFNIEQDSPGIFMNEKQIRFYSERGIELGIHGVSHRVFTQLGTTRLLSELSESARWLEYLGQKSKPPLCFPHGKFNHSVLNLASGFSSVYLTVDQQTEGGGVWRRMWVVEEGAGIP